MVTKYGMAVVVLGTVAVLAGCAETGGVSGAGRAATGAAVTKSLYERLGGKPAITAVVDQFVANVAADGRINGRFATTDIPKLRGISWIRCARQRAGPAVTRGGI